MRPLDEIEEHTRRLAREELPAKDLVRDIADKAQELIRKELKLARVELKADLQAELFSAKGLGGAALCALFALNMLLVTLALVIAHWLPEWLSALLVAVALLLAAGGLGLWAWSQRVKEPLHTTRKTLEEDLHWAKRKLH